VAGREEDGTRGEAGAHNEDGGGSVLKCGDEQLADADCDEKEQSDEFDLIFFLIRSGRILSVSDVVLNYSSRLSSAA
jgi:hypothetical protein